MTRPRIGSTLTDLSMLRDHERQRSHLASEPGGPGSGTQFGLVDTGHTRSAGYTPDPGLVDTTRRLYAMWDKERLLKERDALDHKRELLFQRPGNPEVELGINRMQLDLLEERLAELRGAK
jgi:hypothetical protein